MCLGNIHHEELKETVRGKLDRQWLKAGVRAKDASKRQHVSNRPAPRLAIIPGQWNQMSPSKAISV